MSPKYRDLNALPGRKMADIVRELREQAQSSKTGASGVKDLGEAGDVVWPRPDGTSVSVRDVDLDLADARQRIEDAEGVLTGARARIDTALDAEGHIREDEILWNATLLGETVVEQINVTGKLIGVDGVFTGTVDFANVNVTGTQIVNKLGANSISADHIAGGSFEGDTFTGGTFWGAAFRGGSYATSATPANDNGVMIDPVNGIRAWDSSGQTLKLGRGENFISGRISTTRDGQPGIILTPISGGGGGLWFTQTGSASSTEAAIWSALDGHIHIRPKVSTPTGTVFIDGNFVVNNKMTINAALEAESMLLVTNLNANGIIQRNAPSSSSPANVFRGGSGIFYTTTSSRRYKRNIVDWSPDAHRVLELRPRQWQHDDPANPPELIDERWHVGFVAEEVDELGLKGLVRYEVSPEGEYRPDGLNYDRFAAAQQVVLKKHEAEINELREQIALLEQNQETQ